MTDLDPLLREAMASVKGPVNARPSFSDVRHRARRRTRRHMAVTAGVVACAGVATTALIIRRDSPGTAATSGSEPVDSAVTASTRYLPDANETTTTGYGLPTITITPSAVWDALWNAHSDPSGVAVMVAPPDQDAAQKMPTPEQFGCTTNECRAMFAYVVWHEIARTIGFFDVLSMQAANPGVDFSMPPVEGSVLQTAYSEAVTAYTSSSTSTTVVGCDSSSAAPVAVVVNASHVVGTAKWWNDMLAADVPIVSFATPVNALAKETSSRVLAVAGSECEASLIARFTTATTVEPATLQDLQSLVAAPLPAGTTIMVLVGDDVMSRFSTGATTTSMG
ncbi:MAG: hypothetical protein ACXV98_06870 [Ilumatobacteraceae bacterium]